MILNTPCDCKEPGFCDRHKMHKGRLLWLVCQRDLALFNQWEQQANGVTTTSTTSYAATLPRCEHRGLEVLENVECELCGNRSVMVPVHPCAIHHRCTERRFGNSTELSRNTNACTSCADYTPIRGEFHPIE